MPHRRTLLAAAPALGLGLAGRSWAAGPDLASLERAGGGRLGVSALDTGSGRSLAWRADQRFPFCSSFKAPLAAMVLSKVDGGELRLDQPARYGRADLLSYAPVTSRSVDTGALTLEALCAAAVSYSDNTAANLLLRTVGGPRALTGWMHATGDLAFDLSHAEPTLNLSRFGDPADTTTPRAMALSFGRQVLGGVLTPSSRERLTGWLAANTTGDHRLRAGLPKAWRVGDKTGTYTGGWVSAVDVALAWPPGRAPLVIAVFAADSRSLEAAEAAMAEVGRLAAVWAGP